MTYLRRPHECPRPYPLAHGEIWQCDECASVWRASVPGNPNYAGWRRLGPVGRFIFGVRRAKGESA